MKVAPVLQVLDGLRAPYALIGGFAVAARGFARSTIDLDLLTTDARVLDPATWASLGSAGALVECRRGDAADPLAGVTRIELPGSIPVDVILARWKWQAAVIMRAEPIWVGSVRLPVPIASDLILLKLAAGGALDLRDAAALLAAGDREALIAEVEERLPEVRPDVREPWRQVLELEP
jgi:hypothetical protein